MLDPGAFLINSKTGRVIAATFVEFLSGNSTNPSICFTNSPDSGLHCDDTGAVNYIKNGTNLGEIKTALNGGSTSTVTSVALAAPTGFSVSGSPITESGTLELAYATGYQGFTNAESLKLAYIADYANNYVHPNHRGDVTSDGDGVTTIANNAVSNAKLADMAGGTIKARITAGTGDPEDATTEQVRALLGVPSEGIGYALSLSTAELTDEADIQKHVMSAPGTITELRYQCPLAAPTGSSLELDVLKNGVSILSTRLTIDVGEISSETAAVPAVISDASFEAGDVYSFSRTQGDAGATARGDRIFMFYQET